MEQWSWEEFLHYGRSLLRSFQEGKLEEDENITGIEDHILREDYLVQMLKLNNYMFTTGSTNEPDTLFQPMWIEGYLNKHDALALAKYLTRKGIYSIVQDPITGENLSIYTGPDADLLNPQDLPSILSGDIGMIPDQVKPHIEEILHASPLVGMVIEDPILEHRTLYKTIKGFFDMRYK